MGTHGVHGTHTSLRYWAEADLSKALGYEKTLGNDEDREDAEDYFKKDLGLDDKEAEERLSSYGYDEDLKLGRPSEKASSINTQDNVFGNDRLGNKGMKKGDATGEDKTLRNNFKGNSPLALETLNKKSLIESLDKKLSIKKEESSLLDESQIRE
jgi:hypothetical protein